MRDDVTEALMLEEWSIIIRAALDGDCQAHEALERIALEKPEELGAVADAIIQRAIEGDHEAHELLGRVVLGEPEDVDEHQ